MEEMLELKNDCQLFERVCRSLELHGWTRTSKADGVMSPDKTLGLFRNKSIKRCYGMYGFRYPLVRRAVYILRRELKKCGVGAIDFYLFGYILLVVRAEFTLNGKREQLEMVVSPTVMRV